MKYTIKYNLFRTKATLVDENGRVVATGANIREYAQGATKQPIYIIDDKKGTCSVFSAHNNDFVLTNVTSASDALVFNGVPMLFEKDGKTLYVDPKLAKVYDIPKKDTVCFEQDYRGNPTFNSVFVVHNGMPTPLLIGDNSNLAHNIIRFPQHDSVPNVYRPLMLTTQDEVIYYLGGTNAAAYRALADTYESLEGTARLAKFLPAVTKRFYDIVTVNGAETKEGIANLRKIEIEKMLTAKAERKQVTANTASNGTRISEINGQLMALGQPSYTEDEIRYFRDDLKKSAKKALLEAKANASPEVAELYEEKEALLAAERRVIGSAESVAAEEDEAMSDNYLYGLRIKEETLDQIEKVGELFEIIKKEHGIIPVEQKSPAQAPKVETPVSAPEKSQPREQ